MPHSCEAATPSQTHGTAPSHSEDLRHKHHPFKNIWNGKEEGASGIAVVIKCMRSVYLLMSIQQKCFELK